MLQEREISVDQPRLATMLKRFKQYLIETNHQYRQQHFVFDDVLSQSDCEKYLTKLQSTDENSWTPINFANTQYRYQVIINDVAENDYWHPITNLIYTLGELTGQHYQIKMLGLYSKAGCPQQALHFDVCQYTNRKPYIRGNVYAAPWSLIFGIQDDTHIMIRNPQTQDDMLVDIPRGGVCFLRGDCEHAGAAYTNKNYRLFVSIGTNSFQHDGENVALNTATTTI
jgi:hypothetical protein